MGRSLLSWLLGVDRGKIAQGTGARLKFANPWPTWVILLFAAAAVWLIVFLYRREKGTATAARKSALAVVRCLIVALVVLVLFGPILAVDKSELEQAYVVVLLDDSLSMSLPDTYRSSDVHLALARAAQLVPEDAEELSPAKQRELEKLTRADLVNRVLANPRIALLEKLGKQCKLRVAVFADTVRGLPVKAWGPADEGDVPPLLVVPRGDRTLLGAAMAELAESLRGHRIAAMVVISDGRAHDAEPGAVEAARRLALLHGEAFPVFTVGVGSEDETRDVRVVRILAPDVAKKDDRIVFNALVTSKGYEGEVDVQLHRNGQLVESRRVRLEAGGEPRTVALPYTPEAKGKFRFEVVIPPVADETNTQNNRAAHDLEVKDAKTKVLFVAGQPSYFYRFLKNALLLDPSIELSAWLQSADDDFVQEGNLRITRYPESRKELFEYHVVIFHDVDPGKFPKEQLAALVAFVGRAGGGFILVAGPTYPVDEWRRTKLAELLPVVLGGSASGADLLATRTLKDPFQPRLTRQGRGHGILRLAATREQSEAIWNQLPGCYWYQPVARAKPGTVALVEHPHDRDDRGPMPLVVVGRYDPGRTLFCGLDGTWRWRLWVGDHHFSRFWVQAIDYVGSYRILGGRRVHLAIDKLTCTLGQRVVVQAQCLDESFEPDPAQAIEAKVEMQGLAPQTVRLVRSRHGPGIFEGSFEAVQPGSGTVSLTRGSETDTATFTVTLPATELDQPTMDSATLRQIAERTHGAFVRLHELEQLDGRIQAAAHEITSEVHDPVFDAPLVVILFLGFVCTEWWFRKRGMLA